MTYLLGVDGGTTKTIALIAQPNGTIVGAGRAGCSNLYAIDTNNGAIEAVEQAVQTACTAAGIQPKVINAGAFNMAGADWPEDSDFIAATMRRYGFGQTITVVNDAMGPLRVGSPDGIGVTVVCGTGVAVGARGPDGRTWHSGFWQLTQGAGELGQKALHAVYLAELGIQPPTTLTARILEFYNQPSVETLLHHRTRRDRTPLPDLRHLARVLLDEAGKGDGIAWQIVQAHGAILGDYALVAARHVALIHTTFTLVLAGGVFRHPERLLIDSLLARVSAVAPSVQVVQNQLEPVVGALMLAFDAAGISIDENVRMQMLATLPPSTFFMT
ncbi:BadF/BadG/BcrA/BcrD ATPase family protein [soil metagenome]